MASARWIRLDRKRSRQITSDHKVLLHRRHHGCPQSALLVPFGCSSPSCPCQLVTLSGLLLDGAVTRIRPGSQDATIERLPTLTPGPSPSRLNVRVDVASGDVDGLDGTDLTFVDWVRDELDEELLDHLHRCLLIAKRADIDTVRSGLPAEAIRSQTRPVAFSDVFPNQRIPFVHHGGERFDVIDLHCPSCDCGRWRLCLYATPPADDGASVALDHPQAAAEVEFDDRRHLVIRRHLDGVDPERSAALIAAFEARRPSIGEWLQDRHLRITEALRGITETKPAPRDEPSQPATAAFNIASGTVPAARLDLTRTRSVGRNEPCPCGSGRKFKRCCGS